MAHEAAESLECARDPYLRTHLDEYTLLRLYKELEKTSFIERAVEKNEHRLVEDVWAVVSRVPLVLPQEGAVVVAVEQHVIPVDLSKRSSRR